MSVSLPALAGLQAQLGTVFMVIEGKRLNINFIFLK